MSTRATRLCQNQYLILYRVEEMVGKGCPETCLLLRMEAFRNEEQLLPHYPSPGLFLSALLDLWIWGCSSDALSRNSVPTQTQILCFLKVNQIPSVNMGNFLLDSFLVLWPQLKNPLRSKLSLSHWWGWQPKAGTELQFGAASHWSPQNHEILGIPKLWRWLLFTLILGIVEVAFLHQ